MAQITLGSIPREFEVTRQFEAQQAGEAELKSPHDKLFSADMDADIKLVLGKSMEELSALRRIGFIRVLWGRFGEFVQDISLALKAGAASSSTQPAGTITKSEVTRRYSTSEGG